MTFIHVSSTIFTAPLSEDAGTLRLPSPIAPDVISFYLVTSTQGVKMFCKPEEKKTFGTQEFPSKLFAMGAQQLSIRKKFLRSKTINVTCSLEDIELPKGMSRRVDYLGIKNGRLTLAASEGGTLAQSFVYTDLNSPEVDCCGSNQSLNSLPSGQTNALCSEHSVASWAVSFERLLQDPDGIKYFTEFLKKEFSAENILFWQACENFQQIPVEDTEQLLQEARIIYDTYLSRKASSPVNIDKKAWMDEEMLNSPTPDMFKVQQLQIFNLMKFDSYTRFVKSPLYQECMLIEVEGRSLSDLNNSPKSHNASNSITDDSVALYDSTKAAQNVTGHRPTKACIMISVVIVNVSDGSGYLRKRKKKKLKQGKSLPVGVKESPEKKELQLTNRFQKSPGKSSRKKEKRDSWGELSGSNDASQLRRMSQGSVNSTASLELGILPSLSNRTESEKESPSRLDLERENKAIKYCCVYLPDGTASLASVRPGLTIQEMLSGICEKRGISIIDVKAYLAENDKKPLKLDQESTVLTDLEVRLENRTRFELELSPSKKVVLTAKPNKKVSEVLQPILLKYGFNVYEVVPRLSGEHKALDINIPVSKIANKKVVLGTEQVKAVSPNSELPSLPTIKISQDCLAEAAIEAENNLPELPSFTKNNERPKGKNHAHRRTYEFEGLLELLSKAQSSRVDDQRGLLNKEHLVLPTFLQLPNQKDEIICNQQDYNTQDNTNVNEEPKKPGDPQIKYSKYKH
nr:PREDICTED: regulator of G-protein signaling 14 [Latimeria chalumnae]|eukprot:XP_005992461.1 PREDICTED: regulator of G-protein signaling 14 [Latimeria chalumnae]